MYPWFWRLYFYYFMIKIAARYYTFAGSQIKFSKKNIRFYSVKEQPIMSTVLYINILLHCNTYFYSTSLITRETGRTRVRCIILCAEAVEADGGILSQGGTQGFDHGQQQHQLTRASGSLCLSWKILTALQFACTLCLFMSK